MNIGARIKYVSLFAVGCVLGVAGAGAYTHENIATATELLRDAAGSGGHEAYACIPQSSYDDVFFVSCGGIY